MARLKRIPTYAPSPAASVDVESALNGPRSGPSDQAADAAWLARRRQINAACEGTEFDARRVLTLAGSALVLWHQRRLRWLERTLG